MTEILTIARIRSPYKSKFGIPRQSGVAGDVRAEIVFEPEFRDPDAVRGLEDFSHIWLIWQFSENTGSGWSPTVRPPRLGGNERVGVFATRSPFRPNFLGLSAVELEKVEICPERGPVLHVKGADLLDGTPIFDIKPYIPYSDSIPDASGGFTDKKHFHKLGVHIPPELEQILGDETAAELKQVLKSDPRPQYHNDPERIYGMSYADFEVKFRVAGDELTVTDIEKTPEN